MPAIVRREFGMSRTTILRIVLTFITGSLTGASFVLTKLLLGEGVGQFGLAFVQLAGASALLLTVLWFRNAIPRWNGELLRYFFAASLIALAAGPLLGAWVLGRIPAAIFTVVVTFSPMFTTFLTALIERRLPSVRAMTGVLLGLTGVLLVLLPRVRVAPDDEALALWLALGVPLLLALGNVYRSRFWPSKLGAPAASAGALAMQSLLLIPLLATAPRVGTVALLGSAALLAALVLVTVAANVAGSTLQRVAGATAYSQIGYVIALTGVAAGTVIFNEYLDAMFWPALVLVFIGIVLNNSAQTSARTVPSVSPILCRSNT
jgi:drug/metabolite transporter (DMT)-like permease